MPLPTNEELYNELVGSTESAVTDAQRRLLTEGDPFVGGADLSDLDLSEIEALTAPSPAAQITEEAVWRVPLFSGGIINNGEARSLLGDLMRNTFPPHHSMHFTYNRAAVEGTFVTMSSTHRPLPLTDGEIDEDRGFRDTIATWVRGEITSQEREMVGCNCNACAVGVYEEAVRRVSAGRFTQPEGYGADCRCDPCMAWRRTVCAMIPAVLRSQNPIQRMESSLPVFEEVRPSVTEMAMSLAAQREVQREQDRFRRRRAERGHPLPKQELAADWKPNVWEA